MSKTLEIPDELFEDLEHAAEASGMTPLAWIASQLPKDGRKPSEDGSGRTMADRFAGRTGGIASGKGHLSQDCGAKFGEYLEAKKQAGNL